MLFIYSRGTVILEEFWVGVIYLKKNIKIHIKKTIYYKSNAEEKSVITEIHQYILKYIKNKLKVFLF